MLFIPVPSQNGYLEIAKLLLKHPIIDVNIGLANTGDTALHVASQKGNLEIF